MCSKEVLGELCVPGALQHDVDEDARVRNNVDSPVPDFLTSHNGPTSEFLGVIEFSIAIIVKVRELRRGNQHSGVVRFGGGLEAGSVIQRELLNVGSFGLFSDVGGDWEGWRLVVFLFIAQWNAVDACLDTECLQQRRRL